MRVVGYTDTSSYLLSFFHSVQLSPLLYRSNVEYTVINLSNKQWKRRKEGRVQVDRIIIVKLPRKVNKHKHAHTHKYKKHAFQQRYLGHIGAPTLIITAIPLRVSQRRGGVSLRYMVIQIQPGIYRSRFLRPCRRASNRARTSGDLLFLHRGRLVRRSNVSGFR